MGLLWIMSKLVSHNLLPATQFDRDIVLFIAAKLGATRLIDNLEVAFTPQ